MQIGFIIVSQTRRRNLMRLIDRLNRLYGDPPISFHHGLHQCPIDVAMFPVQCQLRQAERADVMGPLAGGGRHPVSIGRRRLFILSGAGGRDCWPRA
jgi:hypothetical protein